MMIQVSGDNAFIRAIIERYLQVQDTSPDKPDDLANEIVWLILKAFDNELRSSDAFNLPYKDITDSVFDSEKRLLTGSLTTFGKNMETAIHHSFDEDRPNKHHEKKEKYVKRFMYIHGKFVEHILLAQVQKEFIQDSVRQAQETAKKAEVAAESAEEIAKIAKNNADKAEKTYNTMFANYVTILGIFTAIIVTIFGGLNVVDTVISYGNTHFSTIIFLAALVLMCVVCLLYFLAKIILKLNGKDDDNQRFTLECLFGAIFITCIGLIVFAWCVSPTKITPELDKTTDKIEQKSD